MKYQCCWVINNNKFKLIENFKTDLEAHISTGGKKKKKKKNSSEF